MFFKILLLLTVVPITELLLLLQFHHLLSGIWGPGPAMLIAVGSIFVTGIVGATLAKLEGLGVLRSVQLSLMRGKLPGPQLLDAAMILVGAALLLTPGLLTDALGLSLLFPPFRTVCRGWLIGRLQKKIEQGRFAVLTRRGRRKESGGQGDVIDTVVSDSGASAAKDRV